jgi:hypothetical protein
MPFVKHWNAKQRDLFERITILVLDESIILWKPKCSSLGGAPHCTSEPRKPVNFGPIIRDSAEANTGVLTHTEPLTHTAVLFRRSFAERLTHLPGAKKGEKHPMHVAQILHQACNSGLLQGSFCVGDAWFGSAAACLALKLEEVNFKQDDGTNKLSHINIGSCWVVKNNSRLFPKLPLYAVLRARYGDRYAGKWVVFRTEIKGVNIIAMVYAWSHSNVAYFVSTIGDTYASPKKYRFFCEDEFGGPSFKDYDRPILCDFVYNLLPVIDIYNKQHQDSLQVEECWPTHHFWTKVFHAYVGMSAVQMQRLYSYQYPGIEGKDMPDKRFADMISAGLVERERKALPKGLQTPATRVLLKQVANTSGVSNKKWKKKQRQEGRKKVSLKQASCYVCRRYKKEYSYTMQTCVYCGTPVCMIDWSKEHPLRVGSCLHEHLNSPNPDLRCNGQKKSVFDKNLRLW